MRMPVFSRLFTLLCVLLLCAGMNSAQAISGELAALEAEAQKEALDAKVQAILNHPPGVFDVEYADGQLVRLKIKGESEVSSGLGARGDRVAREKAERFAKAAFSKFLNEEVTVVESATEGFIIQGKDGTESAEFLEASQSTMVSLSNSFLRGLTVLIDHVEGAGANRRYVVVLGWSKKLVDAAAGAQNTLKDSRASGQGAPAAKPAAPADSSVSPQDTRTRVGDLDGL